MWCIEDELHFLDNCAKLVNLTSALIEDVHGENSSDPNAGLKIYKYVVLFLPRSLKWRRQTPSQMLLRVGVPPVS